MKKADASSWPRILKVVFGKVSNETSQNVINSIVQDDMIQKVTIIREV